MTEKSKSKCKYKYILYYNRIMLIGQELIHRIFLFLFDFITVRE